MGAPQEMVEGQRGLPEGMTDAMLKQHVKRRSFFDTMDWELLQRLMEDAGMLIKVARREGRREEQE